MTSGDGSFQVAADAEHPARIAAEGELDVTTAPILAASLAQAVTGSDVQLVELDLSAVTFIDSSGLQSVTAALRELRSTGRDLRIVDASQAVRRIFEVTGLQSVLDTSEPTAAHEH